MFVFRRYGAVATVNPNDVCVVALMLSCDLSFDNREGNMCACVEVIVICALYVCVTPIGKAK